MRKFLIAASIAALAAGSSAAQAETICKQDKTGRVVATVVGAGIGAILGNVIDGGRDSTAGTIIGGVAGGLAANQLAKGDVKCHQAYGYYDEAGRWHANRISANEARGYYDRNNRWVEGPPRGYYDSNNRWVAFEGDADNAGYFDRDGRWVPVGVAGYYAADGMWVDATAPGYYDARGRWVAGPAHGRYDANGRWIPERGPGTPRGSWAAYTQPGYYQDGRWVRGEVTGYYDARGRWVSTGVVGRPGSVANSRDTRVRAERIENRIERMRANGELSPAEARRALADLTSIRRDEGRMRYSGGRFTANEENVIHQRLDNLGKVVREERADDNNRPGYYDSNGRWVSTGATGRPDVVANSRDTRVRAERIESRIQRMRANGQLSAAEARRALADLASIRRDEGRMRYSGGRFTANEENVIHQRLDNLGKVIREERDDSDRRPG